MARNRAHDASSLIAFLANEEGAELVSRVLADQDDPSYAHALNVAEVYKYFALTVSIEAAIEALARIRLAGVIIGEDMDEALWRHAVQLRVDYGRMAMADAIGMAFATRLSADFLTADRAELEKVERAQGCLITFIR